MQHLQHVQLQFWQRLLSAKFKSNWSLVRADAGGSPSPSGNALPPPQETEEDESNEERGFRQSIQARRKSPLAASSSYRSSASIAQMRIVTALTARLRHPRLASKQSQGGPT